MARESRTRGTTEDGEGKPRMNADEHRHDSEIRMAALFETPIYLAAVAESYRTDSRMPSLHITRGRRRGLDTCRIRRQDVEWHCSRSSARHMP